MATASTIDATQPQDYPKRILYAVIGLSPQILTETLYALTTCNDAFIPTEIHLLTTVRGAKHCKLALFNENGGWFHRFCKDYKIKGIEFNENHIHILINEHQQPIEDIRTPAENNAVANQITEHIRQFTADANTALHVSIAGGRKTMGFYAGYALSMFGREQDRLSHVLVEPQFEGHPNFFYPTPYSSIIRSRDQQDIMDVKNAKVDLAYLPIVRLRYALDRHLIDDSQEFQTLVEQLQQTFVTSDVVINMATRSLEIGTKKIQLSPVNFVFYCWMVDRLINHQPGIQIPTDDYPDLVYRDEFLNIKNQVIDPMRDMDRTLAAIKDGMTKSFISQRKNGIRQALKKALGLNADRYDIKHTKVNRVSLHGLTIEPENIKFN
ncbi:CRISPR-associated ring nuclease Csm6 [Thiomicrospira sp. R3]|uniref:CRISPR-associated ring nuclease Csm6 n=1 Tax=Thiomicrospira sp. R3 TaxID=3035472 RepID=UPI00259B0A6C|nr:CRISPR-associated ring nuclease Csm6 [Thiomicrospira sp. R3]WFE68500.1 CRISPR-associated ring nuclease Csm6 [Thiomicrospira sp. R3]